MSKKNVQNIQQIINFQTELNYLDKVKILFHFWLYDLTQPIEPHINPPIHPSTQQPIHPPIGGGVSTNHKSSNRIELFRLGQDLFDF